MNLGIDIDITGFVLTGFCYGFGTWFFSRAIRFMFEILSSKTGNIKAD